MTHPVLDDWHQYQVSVKNQVRYYVLTYRFWVILGLILAVAGGITIALTIKGPAWVQHSTFGPTATDYIGGLTGFVPFVAIVTGAFFGGDAISTDFGTKTGYYMLALPVRRATLLAGRYTAAFLTSLLAFAIFYGFGLYGGIAFFSVGQIPWMTMAFSFLLTALLMLAILSFAFCLSSLTKSPAIGLVVTIIVLLIVFNIVDSIVSVYLGANWLWYSVLYASRTIPNVIVSARGAAIPSYPEAVGIMLGYALIFLAIAYVLYDREET